MTPTGERERIKHELREAGMSSLATMKFAARYLPKVIHRGEHIKGVVHGRYKEAAALSLSQGFLVATDRRILFIDRKPGYASVDEIAYDVVTGIHKLVAGPFASVTLHSRIKDYTIRFARPKCAEIFVHYIETRQLESQRGPEAASDISSVENAAARDPQAAQFLKDHRAAVLSTVDRSGKAYGSAVYYHFEAPQNLLILTKSETKKAINMLANPEVAVTVFDEETLETVQITAEALVVTDSHDKNAAFLALTEPHLNHGKIRHRPVVKVKEGAFVVFRLVPITINYRAFTSPQ